MGVVGLLTDSSLGCGGVGGNSTAKAELEVGASSWLELRSSIHSRDLSGTPPSRLDNNTEYAELNTRLEAPDYMLWSESVFRKC